ncbi:MAG: hypothetical protein LBH30_06450 [Prevotellaceae bacterium]|nr:hypothetical protein [Prevotellaceae bacterium]
MEKITTVRLLTVISIRFAFSRENLQTVKSGLIMKDVKINDVLYEKN